MRRDRENQDAAEGHRARGCGRRHQHVRYRVAKRVLGRSGEACRIVSLSRMLCMAGMVIAVYGRARLRVTSTKVWFAASTPTKTMASCTSPVFRSTTSNFGPA